MNNKNIKMIKKNDLHYKYRHFYMEISKLMEKELSCFTTGQLQ